METIRIVLALIAQMELKVYQLDVKSAFLNGEIDEEVYVEQPQGYIKRERKTRFIVIKKGEKDKVYRLQKALYGLKQMPRVWNNKIDGYFHDKGFDKSPSELSLYIKKGGESDFLLVCFY